MVKRIVERYPDNVAFMWKIGRSYKSILYREFWEQVKQAAAGLASLGIGPDDKVAILSNNNPMWPVSDLAICSLGSVNVPIYPTLTSEQTAYILKNAECQMVIVENDIQAEKVLQAGMDQDRIIVCHPNPQKVATHIFTFNELLEKGRATPLSDWEHTWQKITRDDLVTIIHTSGTSGNPKGAMLTHGNFLSNVEAIQFWIMEGRPDDIFLSYLPLSHVFERMAGQFFPLSVGATVAYVESIEKIQENMLEVKPTIMTSVPRLFEKVYAKVIDQIGSGSRIKRKIFDWAIQVGMERYEYLINHPMDVLIFK